MTGFNDLSAELRNRVYEMVLGHDKPVIPSKPIPGCLVTSPLSAKFTCKQLRAEYQSLMVGQMFERLEVIRVNVLDHDFSSLQKLLEQIVDRSGGAALKRFKFKSSATPLDVHDLFGPRLRVRLGYNNKLDGDDMKMQQWLSFADGLEHKQLGAHLRVFYTVDDRRVALSPALGQLIGSVTVDEDEEVKGQFRFIKAALRKAFAPDDPEAVVDGPNWECETSFDINRNSADSEEHDDDVEEDDHQTERPEEPDVDASFFDNTHSRLDLTAMGDRRVSDYDLLFAYDNATA